MDKNNIIYYSTVFLTPLFLTLILTPMVRIFAFKFGFIAHPRPDRWNKRSTALLGGISIYSATIITALITGLVNKDSIGLILGGTILFLFGLADDKFHFAPYLKLLVQIIAGSVAIILGVIIGLPLNKIIAIPLTLLWIIGITNSFNLLDNIDGLAAGIAAISSLMLFFSSVLFTGNPFSLFALILGGAALGFLPYNFNPARIFMGDSGSMFMGFLLAVISISSATGFHISNLLVTILVPVLILSVPIFDTIFVMFIRAIQGKGVFEGGKDHTSHHLVTLGISPRKTVLLLYAISIVFGGIAFSYTQLNMVMFSIIVFFGVVIMLFLGFYLFDRTSYGNKFNIDKKAGNKNGNHIVLNAVFLHKRRIVEVLLDFIFICIAYYMAYFLRFEGTSLFNSNMYLLQQSIIWIILVKICVFLFFGLYRGEWRYVGISDFFTILKVVTLASIASVLFLTFRFRFQDYSRAVFFIDWLVLLFLILGSRFMFRILGELLSRAQQQNGKRVLIFGAGDMGEMVIREIKRNKSLNLLPIGFIDDDPKKIGSRIHGLPVLGSLDQIKNEIRKKGVREVIIALAKIDEGLFKEITEICDECGISYRKIKGFLDE